jgi:enoyl-CoA hydratase/carnithine racemase
VILVTRSAESRIATLTIDRPDARNAFTSAMWRDAAEHLASFASDDHVHAVVVTAVGDVFCAGADTRELAASAASSEDAGRPFHAYFDALDSFVKPLVAAVNGAAVGAGFTMLAYFDIVLASTAARFRLPFLPMGLAPEAGSSFLLPRRLGWQEAAHLLFTGDWLDAESARACGFVWRVVGADEVRPLAVELAERIAAMSLVSLTETKRLLIASRGDAGAARRRESEAFRRLLAARQPAGPPDHA